MEPNINDTNWRQEYLSWKPVSKKQKEILENGPRGLSEAWALGAMKSDWKKWKKTQLDM